MMKPYKRQTHPFIEAAQDGADLRLDIADNV
jgi:hypothetical protein